MEKLARQIKRYRLPRSLRGGTKNWGLKLLSLFFAIFLWYFVVGEDRVDTSVFIPVEIVNLPRHLVISNQFKKQLEVTVSGPRSLIDGIRRQHISRTINLAKAKPGTMVIRNDPGSIPFPRGITVLRIQPTHITLLIDRLIEKDLPIKPRTRGSPAKGFELASIDCNPPSITISGPQAVLGSEEYLPTEPIDLSGLKETVTRQVPLTLKPEILELIGETVVTAKIVIREKLTERTVAGLPLVMVDRSEGYRYRLIPKAVTVRLKGPQSLLAAGRAVGKLLQASVEVGGLTPGRHELAVTVDGGDRLRVLSVSPPTVTVVVSAKPPAKKEP